MTSKSTRTHVFQAAPKKWLVSDHITGEIEKAITRGTLRPGERLLLSHLASQFNVSIIPVREALNRLAARGLVQRDANGGMFVVKLSLEELELILEVRIRLEGLAARLAASRATSEELKVLRRVVTNMANALERRDQLLYSECDLQFHEKLWAYSGNPFLENCLKMTMLPWFGYQIAGGVLALESDWGGTPGLHGQIVDAIESRDGDMAEESIRILSSCVKNYISHEEEKRPNPSNSRLAAPPPDRRREQYSVGAKP
ncbi:MAG: GntR family transcriptional regulator [Planctomycetota bacterium]|jgi:DNA-binding GntR family transcriptional regulator